MWFIDVHLQISEFDFSEDINECGFSDDISQCGFSDDLPVHVSWLD